MEHSDLKSLISEKIAPFSLTEKGKAKIKLLEDKFSRDILLESIQIGIAQYFEYNSNHKLTSESVETFLDKLGGIAYNKSLSPIEKEIVHLKNIGKKNFNYWDSKRADRLLRDYVYALSHHYNEDEILHDLQTEANRLIRQARCWSEWKNTMETWTNDIYSYRS